MYTGTRVLFQHLECCLSEVPLNGDMEWAANVPSSSMMVTTAALWDPMVTKSDTASSETVNCSGRSDIASSLMKTSTHSSVVLIPNVTVADRGR